MDPDSSESNSAAYLPVLPVLFLEFLAISLTRSILPPLLTSTFPTSIYLLMGIAETVKGVLSFSSAQFLGKMSDEIGRRKVLMYTVAGTCAPTSALALASLLSSPVPTLNTDDPPHSDPATVYSLQLFVVLFGISGLFASTFTLTFAYISDTTSDPKVRVGAYGMALATFGASFTLGPVMGGFVARPDQFMRRYASDSEPEPDADADSTITSISDHGAQRVFLLSLVLVVIDLMYIHFWLPESVSSPSPSPRSPRISLKLADWWSTARALPSNLIGNLHLFKTDPFLSKIAVIVFLYYTAVWAVVSTLVLYVTKRFGFGPGRLGELMSAFGMCTVFAEGVLVRVIVPAIGEIRSIRAGLIAFAFQCAFIAFAWRGWMIFPCVLFSTITNLVYPSITGLVSTAVSPDKIGEALGAINGIKALTEGIGPLAFGILMQFTEDSEYPGAPYLLSCVFALMAYNRTFKLPDLDDGNYLNEKFTSLSTPSKLKPQLMGWLGIGSPTRPSTASAVDIMKSGVRGDESDDANEATGLLSEIDSDLDDPPPSRKLFP